MKIGIIDDDKVWQKKAGRIISGYATKTHQPMEVLYFENKDALFSYEGMPMELLLIDIVLDEEDEDAENGIDVAKEINAKWPNCMIVFVTDYLNYAVDVYEVNHIYYMVKEQFKNRFPDVVQKAIHLMDQHAEILTFRIIGGKQVAIHPTDIYYFERNRRETILVTRWGSYKMWDKLDDIMPMLSEIDFVRCHNSFIVYLPSVLEMKKESFTMVNGDKVVISRSCAKNTRHAFAKWAVQKVS